MIWSGSFSNLLRAAHAAVKTWLNVHDNDGVKSSGLDERREPACAFFRHRKKYGSAPRGVAAPKILPRDFLYVVGSGGIKEAGFA
jgi:hypothetical protein